MSKNIVLCSDGTGNQAVKGRGTNVFKLYEALDLHDRANPQIAFYDDGVGTQSNKFLKLLGGAFGYGLSRNIKELYTDLVRNYDPGDRIYLFGFSRGAFTVRSLAGFIVNCGILDRRKLKDTADLDRKVQEAYKTYRRRYRTVIQRFWDGLLKRPSAEDVAKAWREEHGVEMEGESHQARFRPPIRFIGVWDTVDAVGLPIAGAARLMNTLVYRYKFPQNFLSRRVQKACQALSIDDERQTFHPQLWFYRNPADCKTIRQVWFAGVHSNVGGGYPKQGMSLVPLDWMMTRAEEPLDDLPGEPGLRFIQAVRDTYRNSRNANDMLYDSRSGMAVYYRYWPRDIVKIHSKSILRDEDKSSILPVIHMSVFERIAQETQGYAPGNLPRRFGIECGDPQKQSTIHDTIASKFGEEGNPLDSVRWSVTFRHWAHYLLPVCIALLLALAMWAIPPEARPEDGWSQVWYYALRFVLPIVLALLLFYSVGLFTRRRIEGRLSKFWHSVARDLKPVLTARSEPQGATMDERLDKE
jgi:hypothetical protein